MTRKEFSSFKIDNAKERFFNSKDQYLAFKQAWKHFHNTHSLAEYKEIDITPWGRSTTQARTYARVKVSTLGAHHYMIYNLLRGYESTRGFAPLIRKERLAATYYYPNFYTKENPWAACEGAANTIIRAGSAIRELSKESPFAGAGTKAMTSRAAHLTKQVDNLKLPFGGMLTDDMIDTIGRLLHDHIEGEEKEVGVPVTRSEALSISQGILQTAEVERGAMAEREALVGLQYDDRPLWKKILGVR